MQTLPETLQHQSTLPPEIWREIFRQATYFPGLLDVEWSCEHRGWMHSHEEWPMFMGGDIESSSFTKRCIVQVCGTWRALGMEFFSEYLHLRWDTSTGHTRLQQLLEIFESSQSWGRGRWTRAIRIDGLFMPDRFGEVIHLLKQCHQLTIFRLGWCKLLHGQDEELARLFEQQFTHSLRKIDYYNVEGRPALPNIPLQSLSTSILRDIQPDVPQRSFESLSTLTLGYHSAHTQLPWFFPALQHLRLPTSPGITFRPLVASFIERHRKTLVSLFLNDDQFVFWIWPIIMRTRISILQIRYDATLLNRTKVLQPLPNITHLVLYLPWRQWEDVSLKEIFDCIVQGAPFPNVRIVKLVNLRLRSMHKQPDWAVTKAAAKCWHRGIQLEDDEGKFIQFPFPLSYYDAWAMNAQAPLS